MSKKGEPRAHPSYGVVRVTRPHGGYVDLFRSEVDTPTAMCIEVHEAEVEENLGRDWIHAKKQLIEIELSPLQWAEMISSVGDGEGTPCTLRYVKGEKIDGPPREEVLARRVATQYAEELKDLREFARGAEAIVDDALAKGGKMKAEDRNRLREVFRKLTGVITSSGPFMVQQTEDALAQMTAEAKANLTEHARTLGLDVDAGRMLGGGAVSGAEPDALELGAACRDVQVEDQDGATIAAAIDEHLRRIEATGIGPANIGGTVVALDRAGASWNGHMVNVCYVRNEEGEMLLLRDALGLLKALDAGAEEQVSGLTPGGSCAERCAECSKGYRALVRGLCPECRPLSTASKLVTGDGAVVRFLEDVERSVHGKPPLAGREVERAETCATSCGPAWRPGYCDPDCPNAPGTARPEIPDLGPREHLDTPIGELPGRIVAERINVHLKRIDASDVHGDGNSVEHGGTGFGWYMAWAGWDGQKVDLTYVSYQGSTKITLADARTYLAYLREGGVEKHHEALREDPEKG